VFGDLGENATWVTELETTLRDLDTRGARASVSAALR
jgi:hypothetical protein